MSDPADLAIEILKQVRDEIRQTNARLDQSNTRLDRVVQEQICQSAAIAELTTAQRATVHAVVALDRRVESVERGQGQVVDELRKLNHRIDNVLVGPMGQQVRDQGAQLSDHEQRSAALERRAG